MNRAEEWKKKAREAAAAEAVELTLPSGAVILARRPGPVQLAAWGRLPMALAAAAGGDQPAGVGVTNEQAADLAAFLRDLLVFCCVDPRVPEDIDPREIPQEDWTFIINWALRVGEARALDGFRRKRADAGDRGDSEAVLDKTF